MRFSSLCVAQLALALALPGVACAWHKDGHMAVARITWKELGDKERIQIAKILQAHPHYELFLTAGAPKGLTAVEWAFLQAAVWPDWVRDPRAPGLDAAQRAEIKKRFNKPVWHYVNLPYIHPGDAAKFDADAIRKEILLPELDDKGEPRHALAAIRQALDLLMAGDTPDADKAVRLCWLLHVVSDLHQPLHASALIASKETIGAEKFDPPHGDLGGNRWAVKRRPDDAAAVVLHFYWDALLFRTEPGFAEVEAVVAKLLNDPALQRDQLKELSAKEPLAWAEESLELCKSVVYKGDGGFLKARPLPAGRTGLNGLEAPVLPEGYETAAEKVAARRMVLAGYRLADQLKRIFKAGE